MKATSFELFQEIIDFEYNGILYDFHNDYAILSFVIDKNMIKIIFESIDDLRSVVQLVFTDVDVLFFKYMKIDNNCNHNSMLMFQRIRLMENKEIVDTKEGKGLIRLEFENNIK